MRFDKSKARGRYHRLGLITSFDLKNHHHIVQIQHINHI